MTNVVKLLLKSQFGVEFMYHNILYVSTQRCALVREPNLALTAGWWLQSC